MPEESMIVRFGMEYLGWKGYEEFKRQAHEVEGELRKLGGGHGSTEALLNAGSGAAILGGGTVLGAGVLFMNEALQTESAGGRIRTQYQLNKAAFEDYDRYVRTQSNPLLTEQAQLWQELGQTLAYHFGPQGSEALASGVAKFTKVWGGELQQNMKGTLALFQAFHVTATQIPHALDQVAAAVQRSGQGASFFSSGTGRYAIQAAQAGFGMDESLAIAAEIQRFGLGSRATGAFGTLIERLGALEQDPRYARLVGQQYGLYGSLSNLINAPNATPAALQKILGGGINLTLARDIVQAGPQSLGDVQGELGKQYKGYYDSAASSVDKLTIAEKNLADATGRGLVPIFKDFSDVASPVLEDFGKLTEANETATKAVVAGGTALLALGLGYKTVKAGADLYRDTLGKLFASQSASTEETAAEGAAAQKATINIEQLNAVLAQLNERLSMAEPQLTVIDEYIQKMGADAATATPELEAMNAQLGATGVEGDAAATGLTNAGNAAEVAQAKMATATETLGAGDVAAAAGGNGALATAAGAGTGLVGGLLMAAAAVYALYEGFQMLYKMADPFKNLTDDAYNWWNGLPDPVKGIVGAVVQSGPGGIIFQPTIDAHSGKNTPGYGNFTPNLPSYNATPVPVWNANAAPSAHGVFGQYSSMSNQNPNDTGDEAFLKSQHIKFSGPIYDTDYSSGKPGTRHNAVLPGGANAHYTLLKEGWSPYAGGYEIWQTPHGGIMTFLHLSKEQALGQHGWQGLQTGQTYGGGTVVGLSGHPPNTPQSRSVGNDPGFWHLCVVTDSTGRQDVVWLTTGQMKDAQNKGSSVQAAGLNVSALPKALRNPTDVDAILAAAQKYNLPPAVIAGLIMEESGGNPNIVNKQSGAAGLMQVIPSTYRALGYNATTILDPTNNIMVGAQALAYQVQQAGGLKNLRQALLKDGIDPRRLKVFDDYVRKYTGLDITDPLYGANGPTSYTPTGASLPSTASNWPPKNAAGWASWYSQQYSGIEQILQDTYGTTDPTTLGQTTRGQQRQGAIYLLDQGAKWRWQQTLSEINASQLPEAEKAIYRQAATDQYHWAIAHPFQTSRGIPLTPQQLAIQSLSRRDQQLAGLISSTSSAWSGVNVGNLPLTGNGGLNRTAWMHDELQISHWRRLEQDNQAKIQYLRDHNGHLYHIRLKADAQAEALRDINIRERGFYGGIGPTGGIANYREMSAACDAQAMRLRNKQANHLASIDRKFDTLGHHVAQAAAAAAVAAVRGSGGGHGGSIHNHLRRTGHPTHRAY